MAPLKTVRGRRGWPEGSEGLCVVVTESGPDLGALGAHDGRLEEALEEVGDVRVVAQPVAPRDLGGDLLVGLALRVGG